MWSSPVVILLPFFKRFAGIAQCAKQRFVKAFISQFAVEAFNEAILLGLSRCDEMPIDAGFLHPLEDRHAGELGSIIRNNCLRLTAYSDDPIQLACNAVPRQRRISHQNQVLAAEVIDNRQNAETTPVC